MPFTVYDGIAAYAREANSALYHECKTSIFNNPNNQILTPKGKVTMVRQYNAGPAGNYNKTKGWMTQYGAGEGVQWIEYKAQFDRAKVLTTDAIDEEQSYAVGMVPSIELLNKDFLNHHLAQEVDAANISTLFNMIPLRNRFVNSQVGYQTDSDHILETLNNIRSDIYNSGYAEDIVVFIDTHTLGNLKTAIQNRGAFANASLIDSGATARIDTGLQGYVKSEQPIIEVNLNFKRYDNFIFFEMPDNRMYSNILMLSGDPDDEGQERGGYVPDLTNDGFTNIEIMAIPISAAFVNCRYIVDQMMYPFYLQNSRLTRVDLSEFNRRMYGNVEVNNAGINQKANAFEYDVRILYGAALFDNRKMNCYAVTGPIGAQPLVSNITLSSSSGTSVKKGEKIEITAKVDPENAADPEVRFSISEGQENAYVNPYSGEVTGKEVGSATVKATALDGSNVSGTLGITVTDGE